MLWLKFRGRKSWKSACNKSCGKETRGISTETRQSSEDQVREQEVSQGTVNDLVLLRDPRSKTQ